VVPKRDEEKPRLNPNVRAEQMYGTDNFVSKDGLKIYQSVETCSSKNEDTGALGGVEGQ